MDSPPWTQQFHKLYDQALARYQVGQRDAATMFTEPEREFLASLGLRPIFLLDHVEDFLGSGDPDYETTLLIAAARREVFLFDQGGRWTEQPFDVANLPARQDEIDGIPWLPRILQKAQGFLEGNLPEDIMYLCGGDRQFLRQHQCHPADFLRCVRLSDGHIQTIIPFLRGKRGPGDIAAQRHPIDNLHA